MNPNSVETTKPLPFIPLLISKILLSACELVGALNDVLQAKNMRDDKILSDVK